MLDFVRAAKSVGVRVSLLPRVLDVVGTSVVFDEIDGHDGARRAALRPDPLVARVVKRAFDLVGATVGLDRRRAAAGR